MNKDQVKGAAKKSAGKIQSEVGKLVGSQQQQVKGIAKQVAGTAQQRLGDAKEAIKQSRKDKRR